MASRARRAPAYMAPPLLTKFPEFQRRVVDGVSRDRCSWPCAVGHVGVLEYHRGDFELVGYARQHGLVMDRYRLLLLHLLRHNNTVETLSTADEGGTSRTLLTVRSDSFLKAFNANAAGANSDAQSKMKYGDSATAPGATQSDLQGATKRTITSSSVSLDTGLVKTTVSGSRVHSEADMTIRELGLFQQYWCDDGAVHAFVMLDRSTPAAQTITTDQSAAMTYEVSL